MPVSVEHAAVDAPGGGGEAARTARPVRWTLRARLALLASSLLAPLVVAEGALRAYDAWRGYDAWARVPSWYLYAPGKFAGYRLRPGVHLKRACEISVNSLGFRGPEVTVEKPAGTVRIVCLGGSSTFCDGVSDDAATWPARLQEVLRGAGLPRIEVINAGCSGYTSSQSLGQFLGRCAPLSPDWVVFYEGWNDVKWWPTLKSERDWSRHQGVYGTPPWYDRLLSWSALWGAIRMRVLASQTREVRTGITSGEVGPAGPAIWERNLRVLATEARVSGARLVLCTEARRFPDPGGDGYAFPWPGVDPGTLRACVERLDAVTRRVAGEEGALFVDVDGAVSDDAEHLYDHIHLTDRGARAVAEAVAAVLGPAIGTGAPE
ncbi:MAG: SGNH/GDSL hydrolase family protein [Planctomycetes bacterium]|nr:SGNH/GDSL hydrolase family protein [Planctomycetota bacterium]